MLGNGIAKVFIDGEAGTTGLQIRQRLAGEHGVVVLPIEAAKRKDPATRQSLMAAADVVILCLPDDAALEAVALADDLGPNSPRIIDASTAHRTADGWVYGFAELEPQQAHAARIAEADRVSNPGCYATGAIALIAPLTASSWFAPEFPFTINAVSGYTGGGNQMIAAHEQGNAPVFELYGLSLAHKHLPEIMMHAGLTRPPLFVPSVGHFAQGMLVSIPIQMAFLASPPPLEDLDELFRAYYADAPKVSYHPIGSDPATRAGRLTVDPSVGTDGMDIWLFGNAAGDQAVLVARLDNLGKGAAGAAVQNLKLMLGH
ncbi:MAG: N-acetyl-gamma-glutamyl-phosphate reductase [Hyphomicrobiaceae bacterium]|nr:N-acetyl-gamma-glutamyl-phosphate reductase [Hyphomicrobiaceae bacterium]